MIATGIALAFASLAGAGYVRATATNGISTRFKIERTYLRASPFHVRIHGSLHAPKHKCKAGRRVDLYFNRADKRRHRDTRRSTQSGVVVLRGRWHAIPRRAVVIVRSKRITNAFHSYTCLRQRWVWQIHRR